MSSARARAPSARPAAASTWGSFDSLDTEFLRDLTSIQSLLARLPRASQIRVELWAAKLAAEAVGDAWRRSRNAHAAALLSCVSRGALAPPFNARPPDGPLARLDATLALRVAAERRSAGRAGTPPAAAVAARAVSKHQPRARAASWGAALGGVGVDDICARAAAGESRVGRLIPPPPLPAANVTLSIEEGRVVVRPQASVSPPPSPPLPVWSMRPAASQREGGDDGSSGGDGDGGERGASAHNERCGGSRGDDDNDDEVLARARACGVAVDSEQSRGGALRDCDRNRDDASNETVALRRALVNALSAFEAARSGRAAAEAAAAASAARAAAADKNAASSAAAVRAAQATEREARARAAAREAESAELRRRVAELECAARDAGGSESARDFSVGASSDGRRLPAPAPPLLWWGGGVGSDLSVELEDALASPRSRGHGGSPLPPSSSPSSSPQSFSAAEIATSVSRLRDVRAQLAQFLGVASPSRRQAPHAAAAPPSPPPPPLLTGGGSSGNVAAAHSRVRTPAASSPSLTPPKPRAGAGLPLSNLARKRVAVAPPSNVVHSSATVAANMSAPALATRPRASDVLHSAATAVGGRGAAGGASRKTLSKHYRREDSTEPLVQIVIPDSIAELLAGTDAADEGASVDSDA